MVLCHPNLYVLPSVYPYARQYRAVDARPRAEWEERHERAAEAGEIGPEVTRPTPEESAQFERGNRCKTVSEARLAANRANARKSTGPKTPAGKAAASRNALRHGAYSTVMVLPDEDPRELAELQEGLIKEYRPKGILQKEIVARIAACIWRLRRIGYATAQHADQRRRCQRQAEIDHQLELDEMRPTATKQEMEDHGDGRGIGPWLSGVEMVADEIEQPAEKRPIWSLMAAEERTERGMLAAIRLLGRLQKAQGVEEDDEKLFDGQDERNEANVHGADQGKEDAGAASEGCAGGTPAPQWVHDAAASNLHDERNEANLNGSEVGARPSHDGPALTPPFPGGVLGEGEEAEPVDGLGVPPASKRNEAKPDDGTAHLVVRASRLHNAPPPRERPPAPSVAESNVQLSETKPPGSASAGCDDAAGATGRGCAGGTPAPQNRCGAAVVDAPKERNEANAGGAEVEARSSHYDPAHTPPSPGVPGEGEEAEPTGDRA